MEKVVGVNVFETLHDLIENALDTRVVEALVIPRLHQLVKVALHVLHTNVQLLAVGIQENVESRNEVRMCGEGSEKDDFSKFQAWAERFKCLLHRLDCHLKSVKVPSCSNNGVTYHCSTTSDVGTRRPDPTQNDATKASISNLL